MLEENQIVAFQKHLSPREREMAKGRLLNFRAEGKSSRSELSKLLDVDSSVIAEIEESPNYVSTLIDKIIASKSGRFDSIIESLFEKAESGSIKHAELIFKLAKLMQTNPEAKTPTAETPIDINLLEDKEIAVRIKEITTARTMDFQTRNSSQ